MIVNSVVYVNETLAGNEQSYAAVLMAYGLGSMLVALFLPRVLGKLGVRSVMLAGAFVLAVAASTVSLEPPLPVTLLIWLALGAGSSLVQTPTGLLLNRSSHPADRIALFSTQFALSHACWLVTYPLAGWLGVNTGLGNAFLIMAGGALVGGLAAVRFLAKRRFARPGS